VYTGNVHDVEGGTTSCPSCRAACVERDWHRILAYRLDARGRCASCGGEVAGRWADRAGRFGPRRIPIAIGSDF
jgi:pyruvate formate lyase activating enzyme